MVLLREAMGRGVVVEESFDAVGFRKEQKGLLMKHLGGDAELRWEGKVVEDRRVGKKFWEAAPYHLIKNRGGKFSEARGGVLDCIEEWLENGFDLGSALEAAAVDRGEYEKWLKEDGKGRACTRGLYERMKTAEWRGRSKLKGRLMTQLLETKSADLMRNHLAVLNPGAFGGDREEKGEGQEITIVLNRVGGRKEGVNGKGGEVEEGARKEEERVGEEGGGG